MQPQTTLITGASSGIGRAIAVKLLREGHRVIGLGRDFSKFNEEPGASEQFQTEVIDFADLDALPERLQALAKRYPDITNVVCCAGRGHFGSLEEFSYQQIRALMDLNFTSQAYVARALLPVLKKQGQGRLIFMGSEAALAGHQKGSIYCAGKFALRGLAQALREECAKSGVGVSIINPGMVKTPFFDTLEFRPGEDESNFIDANEVAAAVALIINAGPGAVYDEINLSPLRKVIRFDK